MKFRRLCSPEIGRRGFGKRVSVGNEELRCRVSKAKVVPRDKKHVLGNESKAGASGGPLLQEGVAPRREYGDTIRLR